jgi:hypothetical protein
VIAARSFTKMKNLKFVEKFERWRERSCDNVLVCAKVSWSV